jgi:hypothetical protein
VRLPKIRIYFRRLLLAVEITLFSAATNTTKGATENRLGKFRRPLIFGDRVQPPKIKVNFRRLVNRPPKINLYFRLNILDGQKPPKIGDGFWPPKMPIAAVVMPYK